MATAPTAVVLYTGDAAPAALATIAATGRPGWEVSPRTLERGGEGHRAIVEGASPTACTAGSNAAAVRAALSKAESEVAYENWDGARLRIDEAVLAMGCLSEPAEASVGARVNFLSGIVRVSAGDATGAETAFREAIAFQPGLTWDEAFTPDWRLPFDAATHAANTPARVVLGPGLSNTSSVWLDGRPMPVTAATFAVSEGPHLVQLIGQTIETLRVVARADTPAVLLIPDQIGPDLILNAQEPAVQAWLALHVAAAWPERAVYVWTGGALLDATHGFAVVPVPITEPPKKDHGRAMLVGGIAAGAVGVLGTGVGFAGYFGNAKAVPGESHDDYIARVTSAGRGAGMATLGLAFVAAGGVGVVLGLPHDAAGSDVEVVVGPGAIAVNGRW